MRDLRIGDVVVWNKYGKKAFSEGIGPGPFVIEGYTENPHVSTYTEAGSAFLLILRKDSDGTTLQDPVHPTWVEHDPFMTAIVRIADSDESKV